MKYVRKRWHGIPVAIMAAVLVIVLAAGSALAAYPFFRGTLKVQVVEAVAVGVWAPPEGWDNLEPYGMVDDVDITVTEDGITVTTLGSGESVGSGFTAGEWIVIPVNIRNGSEAPLDLTASVTGGQGSGIALDYIWDTNNGAVASTESGQDMCRGYQGRGTWASLNGWSETIAGGGGKSGSAVVGAKVLFVRISAPQDVVPGTYTFTVAFTRG